ncbi:MAG TPA: hemerythrin family protein [Coriobacteriia bacterium]
MHFPWDPALETGNADMDAQHKRLFVLASQLQAAAIERDDAELVTDAVYRLTDYVLEHFTDEESLMHACAYPGLNAHCSLHERLTAETMRFTAQLCGGSVAATALAPFVMEWLRGHIRDEDSRFVAYWRTYGGAEA